MTQNSRGALTPARTAPGWLADSWRVFALAPGPSLVLWAVATASSFLLDRGAMQELMAIGRPGDGSGSWGTAATATVVGWGSDCVVQALWAQLAWQALSGGPTGLWTLWRRLRGAWTGVGLLVAYAALAAAAVGWPQLLRGLPRLPRPGLIFAAALVLVGVMGWVALRAALGVPAAAAEHRGGRAAWRASWQLTRGRLGALVSLLLLPRACGLAVSLGGGALAGDGPGQEALVALLSAAAQCSFGALPGTLYWAWRRHAQSSAASAPG